MDLLKILLDKMITVGSEISSKKFILYVIEGIIKEKKSRYKSLEFIHVGIPVEVDPKINDYPAQETVEAINSILAYLFYNPTKEELRRALGAEELKEIRKYGIDI